MSNFDLGQGVARIGDVWANKLVQDKQEEDQKRLEAQALARLGMEQQRLQMDKEQQAQAHAGELFKQVMALQAANPGGLVPRSAIPQGIDPLTRASVFSDVTTPQAKQFTGAMQPMGADQSQSQMYVSTVAPQDTGMTRINTPFNSKLAVAQLEGQNKGQALQQQWELAQQKNALTSALAAAKDDTERYKIQSQLDILDKRLSAQQGNEGFSHGLALQKSYEATQKQLLDAIQAYARMKEVAPTLLDPNSPLANRSAAEAAIYEGNQKIVNPGMGVRAQQANLYTQHQSLAQRFGALLQSWSKGGQLDNATVQAFMDSADKTIKPALDAYVANRKRFQQQASTIPGATPDTLDFVVGPDATAGLMPSAAPSPGHIPTYDPKTGTIH